MATPTSASTQYPRTAVNKLGRLPNRGYYDYATIHTLLDRSPLLHISFTIPTQRFPVILPMLGCTANYTDPSAEPATTPQDVYLHGHISSRMFQQEEEEDEESRDGLPISIAASFLDGLVLSLTPFHNSCNYRSAVVYGYASLVTDEAEALWAMHKITEKMLPGRWDASRVPPTDAEVKSTGVMRVRIVSASAKIRTGGPSEDRNDLKNQELAQRTWTGVVPYWGMWGEPVPGAQNGCEEVQGYIEGWRVGENTRGKMEAFGAAMEK
ncbi:uncharacterized protein SETTUDRAFT_158817 [Exserohilum turcica Et28A]|uniref:Flavin-nucleotide-binding protein n=1 Tax=Exserohilum turcicum (strain 28A) TaxID=671987 RepID=R0KQY8_EXST2|nr:uncharacterized protein SETTUDRAFT_158817 [Exserohilum turcica Et28A]EOA90207.1 hypothetical protein SETTUDRAFT_158817 [Exserohilum turcica Et28A]